MFLPPEMCWKDEVLAQQDLKDAEISDAWNLYQEVVWLCMAVWPQNDDGIIAAASDVYACPVVTNSSLTFDDIQVSKLSPDNGFDILLP